MNYLFIDTNVILLDVSNLYTISETYPDHKICLSEIVIAELDSKKSERGEVGYQAREFGRLITRAKRVENSIEHSSGLYNVMSYEVDGITLNIFSKPSYKPVDQTYPKLVNDSRIIETASDFNGMLMSNDTMCRIRAEIAGLEVTDFKHVEQVEIPFVKTITVSHEQFNSLHNTEIREIDEEYELRNFSYMFTSDKTGETKLATVNNDIIKVIGKDSEKELRRQLINPSNKEQLLFSALMQDPTADITICEALAGSGKTLVSLSNAMKLIDTHDCYKSIVYIRNTVNDASGPDEEIGFLKGSKEEKTSDIIAPFYDSLAVMVKQITPKHLKGKELLDFTNNEIEKLIEKYNMIARVSLGLRGRTIDDAIIIIDEAQNISKKTMQKILSRVGKNCKVIVIGSLRQIDSEYITKYTSGLSVLLSVTDRTDLPVKINAVTLNKVVRGKITEFGEMVFSK